MHRCWPRNFIYHRTDAFNFALASILSQQGDDGQFYPIAFHSCKFNANKINYEVHYKESLDMIESFE